MKPESDSSNLQPVDVTDLVSNAPAPIPEWFKPLLANSSDEMVEKIVSLTAPNNGEDFNSVRGLLSGLPIANLDVPDWVKLASQKTFESFGLESIMNLKPGVELSVLLETLGNVTRVIETILSNSLPAVEPVSEKQSDILMPVTEGFKELASKSTPEDSATFFNARNDAKIIIEKMDQPTIRAKIYAQIAMNWFEIEKRRNSGEIKSTSDLLKWLIEFEDNKCRLTIPATTDSREIRKACEIIGLSFENQWRKPIPENLGPTS